jgi:hypothetical protein
VQMTNTAMASHVKSAVVPAFGILSSLAVLHIVQTVHTALASPHPTHICIPALPPQDPLSLTPWMNALFALADSGVSSFDTGGAVCCAHPPPGVSLLDLMAAPVAAAGGPTGVSAWLYRGAEKVLGTFKRR